jgi:hypothetical protein
LRLNARTSAISFFRAALMLLCVRENTRQTLDKPSQRADRRLYRCEHFRILTSPSVCDAMEPARVVLIHEGKGRTRRSPRQPWPYALHVLDSEGIRIAVTWFSSVRQSSPGGQGGKLVRLPVLCGLLFTSFHLRGTARWAVPLLSCRWQGVLCQILSCMDSTSSFVGAELNSR